MIIIIISSSSNSSSSSSSSSSIFINIKPRAPVPSLSTFSCRLSVPCLSPPCPLSVFRRDEVPQSKGNPPEAAPGKDPRESHGSETGRARARNYVILNMLYYIIVFSMASLYCIMLYHVMLYSDYHSILHYTIHYTVSDHVKSYCT